MSKGRKSSLNPSPQEGAVTRWRTQHGPVSLSPEQIVDAAGSIGRPYIASDILARFERSGRITREMRTAGEDFRNNFDRAHLEGLRCSQVEHIPGVRFAKNEAARILQAKRAVWAAIDAVGGIVSPGGSCLWNVIGLDCTLRDWAIQRSWNGMPMHQMSASGILIGALGAIASRNDTASPGRRVSERNWIDYRLLCSGTEGLKEKRTRRFRRTPWAQSSGDWGAV